MEIKIKSERLKKTLPSNVYQIVMDTYFGDADGYAKYKFTVIPEKIEQVILEILFLDNQFLHGRGGCRTMYDQCNYFNSESINTKNYFTWLTNYPYNGDYEQNHTLKNFTVTFFDENSVQFPVEINKTEKIIDEIKKLNEANHINDYKHWDHLEPDDPKFQDYHNKVIAYIEKYLLEQKVDNPIQKNSKIKV